MLRTTVCTLLDITVCNANVTQETNASVLAAVDPHP